MSSDPRKQELIVRGFANPLGWRSLRDRRGGDAARALAIWQSAVEHCYLGDESAELFEKARSLLVSLAVPESDVDRLAGRAESMQQPLRFETNEERTRFLDEWVVLPLMWRFRFAGMTAPGSSLAVTAAATADYLTRKLVRIPEEATRSRFWIPESELRERGVSPDEFAAGEMSEPLRRTLWKELVRVRGMYADAVPLINAAPWRYSRSLRRWWLTGLTLLDRIEKRRYEVLKKGVDLSALNTAQLTLQSFFVRSGFRGR